MEPLGVIRKKMGGGTGPEVASRGDIERGIEQHRMGEGVLGGLGRWLKKENQGKRVGLGGPDQTEKVAGGGYRFYAWGGKKRKGGNSSEKKQSRQKQTKGGRGGGW